MPVDPQFSEILAMLTSLPPMRNMPLDMVRSGVMPSDQATPVAHVEDRNVPTPDGPVPVRIYKPRETGSLPLLMFFHGGGFVTGSLNSHDELARALAVASDSVVVAVGYRLAPENPFPAAIDDCMAAIHWAVAHAAEFGADATRLAVAGDSAGGNLAAVAALRLRDEAGSILAAQLLIYPATDMTRPRKGSMLRTGEGFYMPQDDLDFFQESYLGTSDPENPYISPLCATSVTGLAPAFVITGEYDPLCDQGQDYVRHLLSGGVAAELAHYDGAIHGFLTFPGLMGHEATARAGAWLRQVLHQ